MSSSSPDVCRHWVGSPGLAMPSSASIAATTPAASTKNRARRQGRRRGLGAHWGWPHDRREGSGARQVVQQPVEARLGPPRRRSGSVVETNRPSSENGGMPRHASKKGRGGQRGAVSSEPHSSTSDRRVATRLHRRKRALASQHKETHENLSLRPKRTRRIGELRKSPGLWESRRETSADKRGRRPLPG